MGEIDTAALKENFGAVAAHGGDQVALYFYSYLFLKYPETREMFPPAMTRQRDRLVGALVRIVTNVDDVATLVPYLQDLGRDHRKFGALAGHYPAVGEALLSTLRHFSGDAWTEKLQQDWAAAYGIVASTMSGAAEEVAETAPAYWTGEVVEIDRRTFDIAVLRVRTSESIPYLAGQSLSLEPTDRRPREWRFYTPANAPGGTEIELHARLIPGGPVSTALVRSTVVGDEIRLGPPVGRMVLDAESSRPLLLVAGSTGWAPMKAIIDQVSRNGRRPTTAFFGAKTIREAYDREAFEALGEQHHWLDARTVISDDVQWPGRKGLVGEVAADEGDWAGHDAFVCGSPAMVEASVKRLIAVGVPEAQIKFEEFGEA
jgi:NAD(P)H-flavin reductase/hemoglobin-like flavoprotein